MDSRSSRRAAKPGLPSRANMFVLIGLHTGLVEGIDPQQIAGQAAGVLKEIDQLPRPVGRALAGTVEQEVGHAAVHVGQDGAPPWPVRPTKPQGLAREKVQARPRGRRVTGSCRTGALWERRSAPRSQTGQALALLDVLAHGVQVGGELHAGGEQALARPCPRSRRRAASTTPPKKRKAGLVAGQQLHLLAAPRTGRCGRRRTARRGCPGRAADSASMASAAPRHQLRAMSSPAHGDGQQAHGGEDGVAPADGVGHARRSS